LRTVVKAPKFSHSHTSVFRIDLPQGHWLKIINQSYTDTYTSSYTIQYSLIGAWQNASSTIRGYSQSLQESCAIAKM